MEISVDGGPKTFIGPWIKVLHLANLNRSFGYSLRSTPRLVLRDCIVRISRTTGEIQEIIRRDDLTALDPEDHDLDGE
jgi:hypothetical protein